MHHVRPRMGVEGTHIEGGLMLGFMGSIKEATMKGKGEWPAMGNELHTEELSKACVVMIMGTR